MEVCRDGVGFEYLVQESLATCDQPMHRQPSGLALDSGELYSSFHNAQAGE